ncbi:MAG: glycosyltransferase family 2 protein [Acidobacteria bacterium]|nr:MAG: glycosyltransferase family 2 protein [Acidobacteriota bacterium]
MAVQLIFWISLALIVYAYVAYPVLLWALQSLFPRPVEKSAIEPSISLLIAAYNEAPVIEEKISNSLQLDYPQSKLEIVVASDGSTDLTAEIVRSVAERENRVRLLEFPVNRGKVAALNEAVSQLQGEIIVFSDASSMLAGDALRKLVANFADPSVGAASGVYRVLDKESTRLGHQEDFYWKYETFVKLQEARLGALAGAHGSLYGLRKQLYPFPPPTSINDDFVIPTSVLKRGLRIAYEPEAVAYEEADEMAGFGRRVRIMAGNLEQMREIPGLVSRPLALFCFLSHKGTRILVPIAMLAAFAANAALWRLPFYRALLFFEILFYGLAALGAVGWLKPKLLRMPFYFCMINAALFAWFYHVIWPGRQTTAAGEKRQPVVWT